MENEFGRFLSGKTGTRRKNKQKSFYDEIPSNYNR